MYRVPLRATRDGDTQSNVSVPFSMAVNMSSGSLMPSRCRGRSAGSSSHTQRTMVPRFAFSSAPPMPKPSKPSGNRSRVAVRRRSSYCAPWTTANNAWYGFSRRSSVNLRCSATHRSAQRWVRTTDRSWYSRVFISVVHSSKAKIMSAPSWCWMRIDTSGVNRWRDPSRCDLNVTPSSSTVASRFLPGAITSSARTPETSMARTFLNPAPSESTWKPPESVNVGPGQFMKAPSPPAMSMISAPGCRYR